MVEAVEPVEIPAGRGERPTQALPAQEIEQRFADRRLVPDIDDDGRVGAFQQGSRIPPQVRRQESEERPSGPVRTRRVRGFFR